MISLTSSSTGTRRRPDPPASSEEVSFSAALARKNNEIVPELVIHNDPHEKQAPKRPEAPNKDVTKHNVLSPLLPPPKDEVELLKSRNQLKNVNYNDHDHDHDALLSEANSTEIDVDEVIQLKLKQQQQQQQHQHQREPDRLACMDDQHVSPSDIAFTSTTAMTFREVKAVAKELDEQDKRIKDLASAVHERHGAVQRTVPGAQHKNTAARQPFPSEKFGNPHLRPSSDLPSPHVRDYHGDNGDTQSSQYNRPGGGDHASDDIEQSLIQAHVVTTQENGGLSNVPHADIVKAESKYDSILARCIPPTAGSKFLCFAVLVLLAGVICVGKYRS